MKKFKFTSLLLCLLLPAIVYSQRVTPPNDDVQIWNDVQISFPLVKAKDKKGKEFERLSFALLGTLRVGRNVTRPVDERAGFAFDYTINKYFSFTPSYIYRAAQPFRGRKEYEHRVRFDLSAEKKWKNFSLKDRNRVEYRIRNSRPDSVRYRNKIQLKVPVKNDGKEIFAPFVATEPFYDFREKEFTRNEFSAGISKKFNGNVSADFYYLWQRNRGIVLRNVNALGISFKIKVD